ncbi:MAG: SDR family oxidoreductase [Gemmatimonadetes bacterium]|nr:SDR family oxidoreductase [Gemmatimonadota bacterium]NNF38901.1 SDR family oxidoreductase [Gemmatimonadota bacterium]NNK61669.1 SDR family oxidoreductase [Gemmatimonadota bacterium]
MTSGALAGRVAVVTGASSGIGAAVASALAEAGVSVTLGARREDRLRDEVDAITAAGGRASFRVTDVTRRADVEALVEAAREHHGPVDILVCNAGVMPLSPLAEGRVEDWERMVDVNVKGVLYGIAAVLPEMVERRSGHLVTIGSVAGRRPFPGGTVYSATKFAVRSLVAGLQLELSSTAGIRVTDVQPGVVDTELADHIPDPDRRAEFLSRWEARRALRAEDVAAAVLHAVTAPPHVNVNEILLRPTDQPT